jgi:hypothetical protein
MSLSDLVSKKHRFLTVAEVAGGAAAIGFANHKLGAGEIKLAAKADGTGGVPLDAALGFAGIAYSFWKPESKLASHALGLGLGCLSGFAYRTGAAAGDKAAATAQIAAHTTGGVSAIGQGRPAPQLSAIFGQYSQAQRQAAGMRR